jgi:RNA methyltransferase, TrmH family
MTDVITSLQNPRVKLASALQRSGRARRGERKIVLEGLRLVRDAVERGARVEAILYDLKDADFDFISSLQDKNVPVFPISPEISEHISETQQPQGIYGIFPIPMPDLPRTPQRVLILDAIREPGNMGTILRTACASGVEVVLLGAESVDPYNPKVLRAGMGAHFGLPILEASWGEIASYCKGLNLYLAAGDGEKTYTEVDWRQGWGLVIGNEAHGVQRAAQLKAERIRIPMAAATESINAALAAGVIVFEAQRQRLAGR